MITGEAVFKRGRLDSMSTPIAFPFADLIMELWISLGVVFLNLLIDFV